MLTTGTKVVQQEFKKGNKVYPLFLTSNGYRLNDLIEAIVEKTSNFTGCIVIKCTKGYIFDFASKSDTFTVYARHFSHKKYNKTDLYEIY